MTQARRLVDWVGAGRAVTSKGVLRPADVPDLARSLGVTVPARIRTAADVEAVHQPWVAAEAAGWLTVTASRVVAAVPADDDVVQSWWAAVRAVLRTESRDDRRRGAPVLCRTLLTAISTEPADLDAAVDELLQDIDVGDADAIYAAFGQGLRPVEAGLGFLAEVGAVDADRRRTALGHLMAQRLAEEWPLPLSPDLPAAALLDQLIGLNNDERWRQAGPWLLQRDRAAAADELLAAAAAGGPAQRLAAIDVVASLGGVALSAWQRASEIPVLAPHARIALTGPKDDEDEADADPAELQWLVIEYAAAALSVEGPVEAYLLLDEHGGLDAPDISGHPDEAALRTALADLIADGGPLIPTYQLKITLAGVRPPVWRRVRLPSSTTLDEVHRVIQVAFGWNDDHLHVFTADGRSYADPFFDLDDCADEFLARLSRLAPRKGATITYVYDLGDHWEHRITVERIIETDEPPAYAYAVCVGGQGEAPVEDWDPDSSHTVMPFDLAATNRALRELGTGSPD